MSLYVWLKNVCPVSTKWNNNWIYIAHLNPKRAACASLVEREEKGFEVVPKRWKRKTIVSKVSRKLSSSLKGRRMQMNALRTKQVEWVSRV